jgi:hypothetical protein
MAHIAHYYVQHYLTINPSDWDLEDTGVICWMFHPNNNSDEIIDTINDFWGETFIKELKSDGYSLIDRYTVKILPIEWGVKIQKHNEIHIYVKDVGKFRDYLHYDKRNHRDRESDRDVGIKEPVFVKFGDRIILKDEILTLQF